VEITALIEFLELGYFNHFYCRHGRLLTLPNTCS